MRISQLAERTGVPATTLRYYERAGLLRADRTPGGYRVYGADAVARLGFVTAAKRLGLSLTEIAELLEVWGSCAEVRAGLRPRLAARIAEAERRAGELAAFLATVHRAHEHLDALPERDGPCGPECDLEPGPLRGAPVACPAEAEAEAWRGALLACPAEAEDEAWRGALLACPAEAEAEDDAWRGAPVACSLDAEAAGERVGQWQDLLAGAERRPIPDGIRLSVPADRAARIAELAVAEQRCCPFFDFRIHLAGRRLHLEIRAPAEAASLLAGLVTLGVGAGTGGDGGTLRGECA